MKCAASIMMLAATLALTAVTAHADEYEDTINVFKGAGDSADFFKNSYGYAVFPTIGKGGLGVGAAHGNGRVYEQGKYIGDTSMTLVSVGLQAGGEAFSEIIFFENKAAFDKFTGGNFEFAATAQAMAIRSGASASTGTTGSAAGANTSKKAATAGTYQDGMATFTVAKGGLMYEASIAGQKFKYKQNK
jgi:lipid-binding SYLF domain-containing protein